MRFIPENGFICVGPFRGWCGSVHRNRKTASKCIKRDNDHCLKQHGHPTDRDIFDIHDPRVGLKKITIYYLRPKEEYASIELTSEEKVLCIKILKVIFNNFMLTQEELVAELTMDDNDFEHYASRMMIFGILHRVEKDDEVFWRCEKTHDAHKWEEILDDFITLAGGIETKKPKPKPKPILKTSPKVTPKKAPKVTTPSISKEAPKYMKSTSKPPRNDDIPLCSGCESQLVWKFHNFKQGSYYRSVFHCEKDACPKVRIFKRMDYMKGVTE